MTDRPKWAIGRCKDCGKWALMDGPYCVRHYEISLGKPDPFTGQSGPLWRTGDHPTSVAGGKQVKLRRNSQQHQLLIQYFADPNGLTDEEAAVRADLFGGLSCWWKRCSELRAMGWISDTGDTRLSSADAERMVCVITDAGRQALARLGR